MKTNLTEEERLKLQEKLGKKIKQYETSVLKPLNLIIARKQSLSETPITKEKSK